MIFQQLMLTTWLHGTEQTTVFSNSSDGTVNIVTFQLSHRASSRRIVNSARVEEGCRCFAATAASFSHLLTPCLRMLILLALHLLPLLFQTITSTTTGPLPCRLKATRSLGPTTTDTICFFSCTVLPSSGQCYQLISNHSAFLHLSTFYCHF